MPRPTTAARNLGASAVKIRSFELVVVNNYMLERVAINAFHHTISPNIDLLNITFLCQINLMYDVMNERVSLR
jgi:hypothetical protein